MSRIRRFDHVGITVADLDTVSAFFVQLGLEVEGRTFLEGDFLDTVIGIPDARTEIVLLRAPDGGASLELASFIRPDHEPGSPAAMATELGLRSVAFEVNDLQTIVEWLAEDGYGLVGASASTSRPGAWPPCAGQRGSSSPSLSGSIDNAALRSRGPRQLRTPSVALSAGWGGRRAPECGRRASGSPAARGRSRAHLRTPARSRSGR